MRATAFTDGSVAPGNPGIVGAWACVIETLGRRNVVTGFEVGDEGNPIGNGRMEVMAALAALEFFTTPTGITVYSDAMYVVGAINEDWISGWRRRDWKTSQSKDVKHRDLWERMELMCEKHAVEFIHTKGHAGDELNEMAHRQAKNKAATEYQNLTREAQRGRQAVTRPSLDSGDTKNGAREPRAFAPMDGDEDNPGARVVRGGVAIELHLPKPSAGEVEACLADAPDPPMPPPLVANPRWCVLERLPKGGSNPVCMNLESHSQKDGGEFHNRAAAKRMMDSVARGGGKMYINRKPRFYADDLNEKANAERSIA